MSDAGSVARDAVKLFLARPEDLATLEPFVGAYHAFENITSTPDSRRRALKPLLENAALGRIWFIDVSGEIAGYIALCFGYTIEFAGLDAFVDEFFIAAAHRGRGVGRCALDQAADEARRCSVKALHLEVARTNDAATGLYRASGFIAREKYHLMTRDLS